MDKLLIRDQEFKNLNFSENRLQKGDYENCTFVNCILANSDLSAINFLECEFRSCNLSGAIFENTVLEKTDFRTSFNFSIDPEINKIKKAKFSKEGAIGLLYKYNIEIE